MYKVWSSRGWICNAAVGHFFRTVEKSSSFILTSKKKTIQKQAFFQHNTNSKSKTNSSQIKSSTFIIKFIPRWYAHTHTYWNNEASLLSFLSELSNTHTHVPLFFLSSSKWCYAFLSGQIKLWNRCKWTRKKGRAAKNTFFSHLPELLPIACLQCIVFPI